MPDALLVQPASGGRISGGYLYNSAMARHGAWEIWAGERDDLPGLSLAIRHAIVIVDSIWLTEEALPSLLSMRGRGIRVGALIHALPTRIAAAEAGRPVPCAPSVFEAEALARLDFTLVPGPFYARLLAGAARELHVLSPGLDDAWRSPPRRREARCELVSIGAVTPLKGFTDVLDVLERLRPRGDVRWSVAGSLAADAAYAAAFRRRAQAFGGVDVLGQRSPSEVQSLLQSAHALVMPSYEENHPLVLLEAMAASVPSVAYAAGAAGEIVEHGVTGFIGPIGDGAALERHLERLVSDEDRRFAMAGACWERQASIPSWAEAARRARDVLASFVSTRSPHP